MPPSRTPPEPGPGRSVTAADRMPAAPPTQLIDESEDTGRDDVAGTRATSRARALQKWSRLVHSYSSMAALVLVLFFGATGITLNHPEWTLGFATSTSQVTGTLPPASVSGSGEPQFLVISEHLRAEQNVRGSVTDFGRTPGGGFISYRGPGYAADVTFDTAARTYRATVEQQGLVGIANDLHKGRGTSGSWGWLIDVSGVFLVVIALSGLTLQLVLKRRRRLTIAIAVGVGILSALWAIVAIH